MKKITLSLLGLLAFSTSAIAQEVKFGPKAGVNFANLNGDVENTKMLIGFHIGGFAEIKFNDKFAIQPEILYSAQGSKTEYSETMMGVTYSAEADAKLNYINVPIMAKYFITDNFAVEAGPYVGFLASANSKGSVKAAGMTEEFDEDIKDELNSVDFGLGLGASFNMESGFFVGARYNLGLSTIEKDYTENVGGNQITVEAADIKNGVIQVSVGYKF
ncbi:porin family protein [Myroides sp. JBRI-B21084]|uniref:porin family protein n=1 Tax=Myroides sp. JBRI-B21084 TaxID=3119977 RepID=UPI0026E2CEE9|nr:porin family protein [Paenimyroides cloacae]WKW47138.1 porin family protein [Paenimyroides cloacae]